MQGALNTFVQKLFVADTRTRLRPSYFPFTEPSVEVDVSCFCLLYTSIGLMILLAQPAFAEELGQANITPRTKKIGRAHV